MGTSTCVYHFRDCSRKKCLEGLAETKSPRGFVSEVAERWISVVDEETEQFELKKLKRRLRKVSELLESDALLTAVYDDDECFYEAYHGGKVVDRYASDANWFVPKGEKGWPGNPGKLAKAFTWWAGQEKLLAAFQKKVRVESQRPEAIAEAFGIPRFRVMHRLKDFADLSMARKMVSVMPADSFLGKSLRDQLGHAEFDGTAKV